MLVLASSIIFLLYVAYVTQRLFSQELAGYWFESMNHPIQLTEQNWREVIKYVFKSLKSKQVGQVGVLQNDNFPRMIFLSYSDGENTASTIQCADLGFTATLNKVVEELIAAKPKAVKWLTLEVVSEVTIDINVNLVEPIDLDLGREGVALSHNLVFSPQSVVRNHLLDENEELSFDAIDDDIIRDLIKKGSFDMYRFKVESAFCDGKAVYPLYRGHRQFDKLTSDIVHEAIELSAGYMMRSIDKNGKFNYIYHSLSGTLADDYSLIRHAGAIYSLVEMYEYLNDLELLKAAQSTISYLLEYAKPMPGFDKAMVIVRHDTVKLGGTALALLALAKYTIVAKDKQYVQIMNQFANYIHQIQRPNGSFANHRVSYPKGEEDDFESMYYPGESIYALLTLYEFDKNKRWLECAIKACDYIIKARDANTTEDNQEHDHWLLYGLNHIPTEYIKPEHINHVKHICRAIFKAQIVSNDIPDWRGGFYEPPRSTSTATRAEGLGQALQLLKRVGDDALVADVEKSLAQAIRFTLQTQIQAETAMHMAEPQHVMGAFRAKLTTFNCRIDFVQHNVSALVTYAKQIAS